MVLWEDRERNGGRRCHRRPPIAHPSRLRPPRAGLNLPSPRHPPTWGWPLGGAGILR